MNDTGREWDAFISHASEDKDSFVRPLANALRSVGARIWYDEFTLKLGDSLSESIDRGLARSRYGIVVLSRSFMSKPWPQRELRGLVTREIDGHSAILPIWHKVTRVEVSDFSPPLADKVAARTDDADATDIFLQVLGVIRPDLYERHPRSQLKRMVSGDAIAALQEELASLREQMSEFQCPHCQAKLVGSIDAPADEDGKHWDVRRTFECGYREFGGTVENPCPSTVE